MITPPKARRFNIPARTDNAAQPASDEAPRIEIRKRTDLPPGFGKGPISAAPAKPQQPPAPEETDDGFGDRRFPTADPTPQDTTVPKDQNKKTDTLEQQLAAIRAENPTERQLRIARRIAALNHIEVSSDEEAILRLRERGIDPSQRAALGKILSSEAHKAQAQPARNTPAVVRGNTVPAKAPQSQPALPSREALTEDRRAAEIMRIQRDLARRRRRRLAMLTLRLIFFVFLPTAIAGWYYARIASPLYATESQFQIQMADQATTLPGNALSGIATNTDAVSVQSYLTSREAMLRLNKDLGFQAAYQGDEIDPIQRLAPDASNEATYRLYQKSVKIGYDPTEGVLNMKVIAPRPDLSQDFSLALIDYAEGQVDQLTARLREDQMQGAVSNYEAAERAVSEAQSHVQELQQRMGVLDAAAERGLVMSQISSLEAQLTKKELALAQYLDNRRPNQSRVDALRAEIARLEEKIIETRAQLTEATSDRASLAAITGQLRIAEGELSTRQALLAAAAESMEQARIAANKQVRYLSLSIRPVAPDEPSYPKAFQNTIVAFLIFAGIYLTMSLTAAILREQVSS